jgi:hypothetical protein
MEAGTATMLHEMLGEPPAYTLSSTGNGVSARAWAIDEDGKTITPADVVICSVQTRLC